MIPSVKALNRGDEIRIICLDCGVKFGSDSILWATLGTTDNGLCPKCENNNLGRDDS